MLDNNTTELDNIINNINSESELDNFIKNTLSPIPKLTFSKYLEDIDEDLDDDIEDLTILSEEEMDEEENL